MLTLRKRGLVWHVRGTHRVGTERRIVKEHSSGQTEEAAAREYVQSLERDLTERILYGDTRRTAHLTAADAFGLYLDREGGVPRSEDTYLDILNGFLGGCTLDRLTDPDSHDGWPAFVRACTRGTVRQGRAGPPPRPLAAASIARYRSVLMAAMNHACGLWQIEAPKMPRTRRNREKRVRWLIETHADRLIASYATHAREIGQHLRYQGCRTQECLQLLWPHYDPAGEAVFYERTKNRRPRRQKLHPLVAENIRRKWIALGKPDEGHIYLNSRGEPYADTRDYKYPGGNPLKSVHTTAMKKASVRPNGGPDFRLHDWRHHFACRAIMDGTDIESLRRNGGWDTLESVERYLAVSTAHADRAMRGA